jgi:hypothetical protein
MEPALHPDCDELALLLGTWRGEGEGEWPRGEPFRYGEEMTFEHVGDAFLIYSQRAWMLEDGSPLHFERGFMRPAGPGRVELVLAHPLGVAEVAEGTIRGGALDVASTSVLTTTTGSPVTVLERHLEVHGDHLRYELRMAMQSVAVMRHLAAELTRVD